MKNCKLCKESPHGDNCQHYLIHFIVRHQELLENLEPYQKLEILIKEDFIEK